jgi:hypothetical protein
MFQLHVHPEAQAWVPHEPYMVKLNKFFSDPQIPMKVTLWPRRLVDEVIGRPTKPYEFRAFTRGKESHVFVDETETPQSIAWLIAHELVHRMVDSSPTLSAAFADSRPVDMDPAGDEFHEVDAQERFCDGIATRLLGYRQDRAWWRRRIPRALSLT